MTRLSERIEATINDHAAWTPFRQFAKRLLERPLTRDQLRVYLASTSKCFSEAPVGIAALGIRVADDWQEREPFGFLARSALVMYSASEEFGLHDTKSGILESHREFFGRMIRSWGFTVEEITDKANVTEQATELARVIREWYRKRSIADGIGMHLASEYTSGDEFGMNMDAFSKNWEAYGLKAPDDPTLDFYRIHTLVEPMHGETARAAADLYNDYPDEILHGATAFMDAWGPVWDRFNRLFSDV